MNTCLWSLISGSRGETRRSDSPRTSAPPRETFLRSVIAFADKREQGMADNRVFDKCAWRLIPFIFILYLINFVDRVNVGFAALTMNKDLMFSPAIYGFG